MKIVSICENHLTNTDNITDDIIIISSNNFEKAIKFHAYRIYVDPIKKSTPKRAVTLGINMMLLSSQVHITLIEWYNFVSTSACVHQTWAIVPITFSKPWALTSFLIWKYDNINSFIHKNNFACLFSVHNTVSLSRHEQVSLMRLRFKRHFSHHQAT